MRDLTDRSLNLAHMRGARYADIRIVRRVSQSVSVKNGRVEVLEQGEDQGFGVRVLCDGAWGFASSHRVEPAEVERITGVAVEIARASALFKRGEISIGPPVTSVGTYRTPVQLDPFAISLEDKIGLLLSANEALRIGPEIVSAECTIGCLQEEKVFANSEGAYVEQTLIETGGGMECLAVGHDDVQKRSYPNSFGRHQGTAGYELIREMDLVGHAPRLAEEAIALLTAPPCPSAETTVILGPAQLALQIHESCGHPIELDRVFGSEAAYAGTSFLTPEKLGIFQYGSAIVNITADATTPGGLGTFGYDDEGVPAQATPIVRGGVFVGYLTSRETAARLGQRSNGSMRADGWSRIPLIRMTNINLEPGEWRFDELIADTDEGVYMEMNKSWSIDDKRLNFQFATEIAYEIKKGKLGRLLKNATYTGMTPQFWAGCDAICCRDYWKVWGTVNCGKGQPSQIAHVGHGTAPARFRKVRIGVMP